MKNTLLYIVVLSQFLLAACKKEDNSYSIEQKIERIAKKYVIYGRTPGIIIGTIINGEKKIYTYGVANLNTGAAIDENTIFEIGSITKTFNGVLFANYMLQNRFLLSDTANKYLPQNIQLPSLNNRQIKIVDLLNHTSGLPREPDDIDMNEPFFYSESQMSAYLQRLALLSVPGEEHFYSNTGAGLSGYLIQHYTDTLYSDLLNIHIFEPLGMNSTFCNNSEKPVSNVAQGYNGKEAVEYFKWTGVFDAAGIIKSNMHDKLIYLDNCINTGQSVLGTAIELAYQPTFTTADKSYIGLGWFSGDTDNGDRLYYHNGGTRGFASFIGINKTKNYGFVILINSYCFGEQDNIGIDLFRIIDGN